MKKVIRSLYVLHFCNDGFFASLVLLLPFIAKGISIGLDQVGMLTSIIKVFSIFLLFPITMLCTRISSYKIILAGLLIYSLGILGTSAANSFIILAFFSAIAGIGFVPFHALAYSLVSRMFVKGRKGRVLGAVSAAGDTGKLGLTFLVTTVVVYIGWRLAAVGLSLFGIVVFVILFFLIAKSEKKNSDLSQKEELAKLDKLSNMSKNGYKRLLKEPKFLLAVSASTLDYFAGGSFYIFLPYLLLDKGLDPKFLGAITGALFLGNIAGKTVLARITDKFGHFYVLLFSEVFMTILIFILLLLHSFIFIAIILVILGVFTKGTGPVLNSLISDSVDHLNNFEKAFSISETSTNIAGTIAPLVFGLVGEMFGIRYAFVMMAVLTLTVMIPASIYKMKNKESRLV